MTFDDKDALSDKSHTSEEHISLQDVLETSPAESTGWLARGGEVAELKDGKAAVENELNSTKVAFEGAKEEFSDKAEDYERALFELDQEFEGQTAQIRAEYEEKVEQTKKALQEQYQTRLNAAKSAMRGEVEAKLTEQGGRLRQDFLQEKLNYESEFNSKSQRDVLRSLEAQSELVTENKELKDSLDSVRADLESVMRMRGRMK